MGGWQHVTFICLEHWRRRWEGRREQRGMKGGTQTGGEEFTDPKKYFIICFYKDYNELRNRNVSQLCHFLHLHLLILISEAKYRKEILKTLLEAQT